MTTKEKSPSRTTAFDPQAVPDAESIQQQANRILTSPEFRATDVQKAFLTFVVETALAGRSHEIKGLHRGHPGVRPGRRIQPGHRSHREHSGQQASAGFRTLLPGGRAKRPMAASRSPKAPMCRCFGQPSHLTETQPFQERRKTDATRTHAWPTIVVQSFENLTGNRDLEYMGIGIATEIALEITRYQEIRVLRQTPEGRQRRSSDIGARFVLCGSIKPDAAGLKVIVSLVDGLTGVHIWGDSYRTDLNPAALISFEERIASTVVSKISCEYGVIAKTLSAESKRVPPEELTTYQAMLRFYRFLADFSPETFVDTFEALHQACTHEPECGLAWSMLARLYSLNYSLELFDLETPLEKAAAFAEKGGGARSGQPTGPVDHGIHSAV
jgi:adenylate cyclase